MSKKKLSQSINLPGRHAPRPPYLMLHMLLIICRTNVKIAPSAPVLLLSVVTVGVNVTTAVRCYVFVNAGNIATPTCNSYKL